MKEKNQVVPNETLSKKLFSQFKTEFSCKFPIIVPEKLFKTSTNSSINGTSSMIM